MPCWPATAPRSTLTVLALTLAGSDLAGSASLHLGGDRPRLEAELTAHRLDPRDLLPPGDDPAPPAGATTLFPTTPLPLADLDRLDLQLHLRADTVATPALALDGVELTAALAAGRLNVAPLRFALLDRPVQGALEADAAPARLAVRLAGDDVDLGRLLAALAHTTLVEGRGDFRLQLEGQGASPHALAATASGRASVLMGPGRLPGQLLSGARRRRPPAAGRPHRRRQGRAGRLALCGAGRTGGGRRGPARPAAGHRLQHGRRRRHGRSRGGAGRPDPDPAVQGRGPRPRRSGHHPRPAYGAQLRHRRG